MKPTILVVDDDEGIRDLLREALAVDYEVVEAGDGYGGLSEVMVGQEPVDLVVTDLKMPGQDGLGLIRDLPNDIPVIVISGYLGTPPYQLALERLKPAAIFAKPFEMLELRGAIREALGH